MSSSNVIKQPIVIQICFCLGHIIIFIMVTVPIAKSQEWLIDLNVYFKCLNLFLFYSYIDELLPKTILNK